MSLNSISLEPKDLGGVHYVGASLADSCGV